MHNTSIIGWVKINALHIDSQVDDSEKGGQATLEQAIFRQMQNITLCHFFQIVKFKIVVILPIVNKVVSKVKLDIRDPPTY